MSNNFVVPICKAKVEREGIGLPIVAHNKIGTFDMDAANLLAKEGIDAKVIDVRSIRL
ncbi:hypothetical protein BDR07DRAFT_1446315 [Suillus spraguei]|nr:hypothetical protein BDR07DRAFT_1446315 [Suillus spraguei]